MKYVFNKHKFTKTVKIQKLYFLIFTKASVSHMMWIWIPLVQSKYLEKYCFIP